jgi:hypothetical protein
VVVDPTVLIPGSPPLRRASVTIATPFLWHTVT